MPRLLRAMSSMLGKELVKNEGEPIEIYDSDVLVLCIFVAVSVFRESRMQSVLLCSVA